MSADEPELVRPSSDQSLLRKFQAGDADAATQLYLRYAKRLQALAKAQVADDLAQRVDPEDIVQSVFRTFFRRVSLGQYDVPEGEDLWRLFLVISLNKVREVAAHHRAAKRDVRATAGAAVTEDALRAAHGPDEEALAILRLVIDQVLSELPPAQRRIIELRIEGFEVAEIARQSGRAKRSVERVLQEFRNNLQSLVHEES